jgi:hypothetical protein
VNFRRDIKKRYSDELDHCKEHEKCMLLSVMKATRIECGDLAWRNECVCNFLAIFLARYFRGTMV